MTKKINLTKPNDLPKELAASTKNKLINKTDQKK